MSDFSEKSDKSARRTHRHFRASIALQEPRFARDDQGPGLTMPGVAAIGPLLRGLTPKSGRGEIVVNRPHFSQKPFFG